MANEQNLISLATRTQRERTEIARKGQKAAQEAKRRKKTMRELASIIAAAPVTKQSSKKSLEKLGFDEEDMTHDALVTQALYYKCLEGDVKAIEKWEELTSTETDNTIEALHELLDGIGTIE